MRAFRRRRGMYVARLDDDERGVMAALVADVAELLGAGRIDESDPGTRPAPDGSARLWSEAIEPPSDPAVRRLLPDASRDDPEVSARILHADAARSIVCTREQTAQCEVERFGVGCVE